jgi:hypothetical protein
MEKLSDTSSIRVCRVWSGRPRPLPFMVAARENQRRRISSEVLSMEVNIPALSRKRNKDGAPLGVLIAAHNFFDSALAQSPFTLV